ncbi:MAG: hypothetical protein ACUVV0_17205, partial [Anaerolineae bacterium]
MSTRINLFIEKLPMRSPVKGTEAIRILCGVTFRTIGGYTHVEYGIIDTGSPISIIPLRIWSFSKARTLGDYEISGLVDKEECRLAVSYGQITCRLFDDENISPELEIHADFAYTDRLPIILGLKDLLENTIIY